MVIFLVRGNNAFVTFVLSDANLLASLFAASVLHQHPHEQ